jgi:hypothetical protein
VQWFKLLQSSGCSGCRKCSSSSCIQSSGCNGWKFSNGNLLKVQQIKSLQSSRIGVASNPVSQEFIKMAANLPPLLSWLKVLENETFL